MKSNLLVTAVTFLAAAIVVGCSQERCSNGSGKPVEGNPGATTNQSMGYDASDPSHYHPLTDDTHAYHPTDTNTVQQSSQH